jgi:hypothetical protein
MYRRKVIVTAAAVFAIGMAIAAQPVSLRADRSEDAAQRPSLWVPGTATPMSAHETGTAFVAPPQ